MVFLDALGSKDKRNGHMDNVVFRAWMHWRDSDALVRGREDGQGIDALKCDCVLEHGQCCA